MKKLAWLMLLPLGACSGDNPPRKTPEKAAQAPPARPKADPKAEAIREEMARLQGTWQMVSADRDGAKVREANVKKTTAVIKDDLLSIKFAGWTLASDLKFEVDPTQSPGHLTEFVASGKNKGKPNRGIYALEGDKLTICTAATDQPRPTDFVITPGAGHSLRVFRKMKAK